MNNIQALVLCGGKGERLRPLTDTIPKPLIHIRGKPILSYLVNHINSYKINQIIFATGYNSQKISDYLSNNFSQVDYILSDAGDVDILERIKYARKLISSDIIVFYGDTIADIEINKLVHHHRTHQGKATITVYPLRSQFGILELEENNLITSFIEKPILDKWINIGYLYLEQSLLTALDRFNSFEEFLNHLVYSKLIYAYKHEGIHITVNTLTELKEAEKNIHLLKIMKGSYE
jgi:NDP-sugar pyrophosphorylase family protein